MKTTHSLLLLAALSPAALLLSGCAKTDAGPASAPTAATAAKDVAAEVKVAAADSWDGIKNNTYEKRADFAGSLERMAGKLDMELEAINAKLTGLPDAAARNRDRASKEFREAHTYLRSQLTQLRSGTADTWDNAKEKVAQSWQAVQAAYEKVKASPTS